MTEFEAKPPAGASVIEKLKFSWAHRKDPDRQAAAKASWKIIVPVVGVVVIAYNGYNILDRPSRSTLVTPAAAQVAPPQAAVDNAVAWCQSSGARSLVAQLKAAYFQGIVPVIPTWGTAMGRYLLDGTIACAIPITYDNPNVAMLKGSMSPADWAALKGSMGAAGADRLTETVNYRIELMGGSNIRVSLQQ